MSSASSILHTLGYEKRSLDEFLELLLEAGIGALVDVRETAWSHKPGFSKTALSTALASVGIAYVRAAFAGNPKELRDAAADHRACLAAYRRYLSRDRSIIERFDALVTPYLADGAAVCIICYERHAEDCHRSILADAWRARGRRRVKHLAVEGCPRLLAV